MRPAAASNSSNSVDGSGFQHWNSPVPYLFAGLALTLGLIAMALLILACSYKTSPSNSPPDHETEENSHQKEVMIQSLEMEPKIVVVMAGDHNPTYLAKPVACTCQT
ncbi:hypothetical protein P3X46_029612 [Hevea brasiliensis]|uniref:Uncharacterized protein n=1 Tax=Hevea brasiliensis TaxID=3981 RepID=A0ABQ9KUF9_HEVBR|nr:hypothetical protein P3X46_029603 [Hevea brasiliensis]KAJ9147450.1 hypothetical protein P3X46_029612 [Hevea brasiliensis]